MLLCSKSTGGSEMEERKTTEAKRKAIYKYDEKFERVNCRFQKGTKERISKIGYKSVNDFIKLAVAEKLEHDEKILDKAQNVII
jgi:hypothetical protein